MSSQPRIPAFVDDLKQINIEATELSIKGKTKNLKLLSSFNDIDTLWITTVNQKELEFVLGEVRPKNLFIYEMRVTDLTCLEQLKNLEVLKMTWNSKALELWNVSYNNKLKILSIEDFSKLKNIASLKFGQNIEALELSGGMWNELKLDTLDPLKGLENLKKLTLSNISVSDQSLEPVSYLTGLEELKISNKFPTEEYARLSVRLVNTKCDYFKPYIELNQPIDDKDVMVIGKGKPFLNSKRDAEKLRKCEEEFWALQRKFM